MWIKNVFLLFFGLCAGGIIAAGVYAFLAIIGVFVRMIGKTKTKKHIMLYENMIILGGVLGNIMELYKVRLPLGEVFGQIFLLTGGVSVGIFTGCLVMSLAETLKALPTFSRRQQESVAGLYYISGKGWQPDEDIKNRIFKTGY